ncbi:hypothetical protein BI364_09455 [Acidihalobacter yilgarnensis]|uniref:TubC N-terminal docking domain-containing protein n=1 Tax=Acidihalobacter yilgarnensis TaxID=2819280 RepID=A0A1D8INY2_9GAMM|nr:hypothetical protein [Acidihalobacter yilgarnensis]AOU98152.1 hypothetical protein BI364_09455 [Acidihalobacter yilgarnensis]
MTPDTIRRACAAEGLVLQLREPDTIVLSGPQDARERWAPIVREHKTECLRRLRQEVTHGAMGRRQLEVLAREFHVDALDLVDWYLDDLEEIAAMPLAKLRSTVRDYIKHRPFYRGGCRLS